MPQLRAGVDLSRQDGAAGTVVLEVRLQGRVVFGVVVAPVGEHRGAGTSAERPARAQRHGNFWLHDGAADGGEIHLPECPRQARFSSITDSGTLGFWASTH